MMKRMVIPAYWMLALASMGAALWVTFARTPDVMGEGFVQKIFYIHLPIAINTFLACTVVFVGSAGYLLQRKTWWDDLAVSAAKVAVVLCSGVLLTGMIWAHVRWNAWWKWEPRLTFSFMLWLLYVVYLLVRMSIDGAQRRAMVGAVYGLVAFLDVPLVYLSSRLLRSPDTMHPVLEKMDPELRPAVSLFFVTVTLTAAGLIVARYKVARRERALRDAANPEPGEDATHLAAGGAS